jgi:PKD repeat protein
MLASMLFDVTEGGNGFCDADNTLNCGNEANAFSAGGTFNPNALGAGNVDCSFPRNTNNVTTVPTEVFECNAQPGYDGPSGLGAPSSDALFTSTAPTLALTRPASLGLKAVGAFTAKATERLTGVTGLHLTKYFWTWGDGTTTTDLTSATSVLNHHTYTKPGAYTISMIVVDNTGQQAYRTESITVGQAAAVRFAASKSLVVHRAASFSIRGTTDANTGAKITKVTWKWGDGHATSTSSTIPTLKHTYSTAGTKTITIVVVDSTGVRTTVTKKVKVKS